ALGDAKGRILLWDIVAGKEVRRVDGHGSSVRSLSFSADGKHLASAAEQGRVKLWEFATLKERGTFQNRISKDQFVAVANGGRYVAATVPLELRVRLWDMQENKEILPKTGHVGAVRALSCAWDGKVISSSGRERTLRRWDAATGKELLVVPANTATDHSVAFSPDGLLAVWGDAAGKLHVVDWKTGKETQVVNAHTNPVQ